MKHADAAALDRLEDLLQAIRMLPDLKERSRGIFYRRSKSFLHFHDDPSGLFADLRKSGEDGQFERFRVNSPIERQQFLEIVRSELDAGLA